MDCEELIMRVFDKRSLWDQKNKNYHNRDVTRREWIVIGTEMNTTAEAVKSKWRNLRDTFRKELHKQSSKEDVGGEKRKPLWQYHENMLFLRDQLTSRKLTNNHNNNNNAVDADSNDDLQTEAEDPVERMSFTLQDNSYGTSSASPQESQSCLLNVVGGQQLLTHKTIKRENNQLLNVEEKQRKRRDYSSAGSSSPAEDADYHFLMSLLPFLQNVPSERKLIVRTQLQQVFIDEEYFAQQ